MKKHFLLFVFILLIQKTYAQKSLGVGDTLPVFFIHKLINPDKKNVSTSNFRNQLLIIDFWSIYCSGCVAALPEMEKLQQKFGNKLKILPTTNESEELVKGFWKKNSNTKNLTIPSIVNDTLLHNYFKHLGVPHEVWIYKNKVIAITHSEYVNEQNIKKVLDDEEINWPVKSDFNQFDGTKDALFKIDENQINIKNTPIQYAAISDFKEGVNNMNELSGSSGMVRDKTNNTIRTFFLNYPIYALYHLNLNKLTKAGTLNKPSISGIGPNEILWEVKDTDVYKFNPGTNYKDEWIRKNGICFESSYQDTGQKDLEISKSIVDDLNHLLGLQVRWEKRKEKVYLLVRTNKKISIKSKGPLKETEGYLTNEGTLHKFRDTPLSTLVYKLNQEENNPYIFDKSDYNGLVDLTLQFSSWTDLPSIKKALQLYGLGLKEEEQIVDKLIFTEINGGLLYTKQTKPE